MKELKIYVNDENMAMFACPACEQRVAKNISQFKEFNSMVRIQCQCACGNNYTAILERRKFFRKKVTLPGTCMKSDSSEQFPIIIQNLSRSGLRFQKNENLNLKIGDILNLSFNLSDNHNTLIQKQVRVRTISATDIGTVFTSRDMKNPIDKAYELAIGFYTFKLN